MSIKYKINIEPERKTLEASEGKNILNSLLKGGINHLHACGGQAKCTTCRIRIVEGKENLSPTSSKELGVLEKMKLKGNIRLACQCKLLGNITIQRLIIDVSDSFHFRPKQALEPIGVERIAAILFADIENYSGLVENCEPYDIVHLLKSYFDMAGEVIKKHLGTIVDYYGDGFLAAFYQHDRNVSFDAVEAAFQLFLELEKLDEGFQELLNYKITIRIGIHTGPVIMGSIGIHGMEKLALIGDTVNMAQRIEETNKLTGTRLLVSNETFKQVNDEYTNEFSFNKILRGKSGHHSLHSLVKKG